jgi:hypothetical protein
MLSNRHYVKILVGFIVWVCLNLGTFGMAQSSYYPGINPKILNLGLKAYQYAASQGKVKKSILVLVDFSKKSVDKRMWVLDLKRHKVLFNVRVSHGQGSGSPLMATSFSNQPGSKASSLGTYVTGSEYSGRHGDSLRLQGIEKGINDKAFARTIVLHPASYMSQTFVDKYGYSGRSWGCFAVSPNISAKIINIIEEGSVLFAYGAGIDSDPNLS